MMDPRDPQEPLAKKLRPALSPERVELVWRRIAEAREAGDAKEKPRSTAWLSGPRMLIASAGVAAAVALFVVLRMSDGPGTEPAFTKAATSAPAIAPLTLSDGAPLAEIATLQGSRTIALSDGSQLDVSPGSRLKPLDVSERSVLLHLVQGKARFSVKPGGPRRWVVEAGSASVEVVGTRFTVERMHGVVNVEVEEGKVLVRGAAIEDGVTRLGAGESLTVSSNAAEKKPSSAQATAEKLQPRAPIAASTPARTRTRAAEPDAAKKAPPRELLPLGALDADSLLALADQARMSRDYRGAIGALGRVVHEHPNDPRARLAAFTMGRIREEELHDRAGAALAYEDALRRGLSGSLAEDCSIRLVRVRSAQVARGEVERERAAAAARNYLARHPSGRYAAEAQRALDSASGTGD